MEDIEAVGRDSKRVSFFFFPGRLGAYGSSLEGFIVKKSIIIIMRSCDYHPSFRSEFPS